MILSCKVPKQGDLKYLDSQDLAFLTLTGHVEWIDPFDAMFLVQKAIQGHGSKEYLWGPQADLLSKSLIAAWKKVSGPYIRQIQAAFDLSGDISVSEAKLKKALARSKKLGEKMWPLCKEKTLALLADTVERSKIHFTRQKELVIKGVTEEAWQKTLAAASADHVKEYMLKYPDRMLHPEIQRLADLTRLKPDSRTIDKIQLRDRILKIQEHGESYFANLSDVQVGRLWTNTGIQMAHDQGVTEYMVVSEADARVCPVCRRLNGKHFAVADAYGKMQEGLKTTDPGKLNNLFPFPRTAQLDNKAPKQIRAMGLRPPFHGKCRCDVEFLWRQAAIRPRTMIPTKADITEWQKNLATFNDFQTDHGKRSAYELMHKFAVPNIKKRIAASAGKSDYDYFCKNWENGLGDESIQWLLENWAGTSGDSNALALFLQKAAKEEFGLASSKTSHFGKVGLDKIAHIMKGVDKVRMMRGARVFLRAMYNETQATFKAAGIKELTLFRGADLKKVGFDVEKQLAAKRKVLEKALADAEAEVERLEKMTNPPKDKLKVARRNALKLDCDLEEFERKTVAAGSTKVGTQPMSSFSMDFKTARIFMRGAEGNYQSIIAVKVPVDHILSYPRTGFGNLGEKEIVVLGGTDNAAIAAVKGVYKPPLQKWIEALKEILK